MRTKRITSSREAAEIIQAGGLVAFPTETVFGLGADATNEAALQRLFQAKGRPSDNPLIVHLAAASQWPQAASTMTDHAEQLLAAFAPGPLTVVLPKHDSISSLATAGLSTVGIRIPKHPAALAILHEAKLPVAAPSANRSGKPSGTTWRSVLEDLEGRIDAVYCEDSASIGIESTVVDCCHAAPIVLRPGAVTMEQLRQVTPDAKSSDLQSINQQAKSPGLMHPHYQPAARVTILSDAEPVPVDPRFAYCGMQPLKDGDALGLYAVFPTVEDYAAQFYEFLREADRRALSAVFVQAAPAEGIGRALLDRQHRASGGRRE